MRFAVIRSATAIVLLLAAAPAADAQRPPTIPRLCYLAYAPSAPHDGAFLQGLRDLGYVDGRNLTIDSLSAFIERVAENKPENVGVRAAESTLTCILGQMAIDSRREVTWDEMMRSA